MATKQNWNGTYISIAFKKYNDTYCHYCITTSIDVEIKKGHAGYSVEFGGDRVDLIRTLNEAKAFALAHLNSIINDRIAEKLAKEEAEKLAKEEAEKLQAELDAAIIAEVKATVKLSYIVTNCDNDNLSTQLNSLLSNLADKYQSKLELPVVAEDYYGYYQNYANFSVVELESGLCEFTAFIGTDIVQFIFNGHSSVNTAIINEIDNAINQYVKTGKIKQKAGKKPSLKIADKHNKSVKRSKEAIALAALAKNIRNTYTVKPSVSSPLERMVSDWIRVISVDGLLQVIAVDKFDRKGEHETDTIKTFTVGQTVGRIDLAIPKIMLSEILKGIGSTGLFNLFFEQKDNNLIITHRKGRYELVGLDSDELITLFHPDEVVTETAPVMSTTEGDNYILPTTQKVQLIETTVCEVVPSNEVTEITLDDVIGIDSIDSQLFPVLIEIKPEVEPVTSIVDNVKIVHVSSTITDITKLVIKPETTKFEQLITPIGDTDKKGYTQSTFFIKTTKGYEKRTGFVKGQIAISQELNCDTVTHIPSGCKIGSFNKGNVFVKGKKTTKKDVQIRVAKLVDALNDLDFITSTELNKLQCLICYVYMQAITNDRPLEESILSVIKMLEVKDEHNLLTLIKKYFNYEIEEVDF